MNSDKIQELGFKDWELYIIYYNFFKIFDKTGNSEKAKEFIDLSHKEIIQIASNLKSRDKNRFLTENKLVSEIIKDWFDDAVE